jgi:hypothetical protein
MARLLDRLAVLLYVAVIALPVAAMITHARDVHLSGSIAKVERPRWTWSDFAHERSQHAFAGWFEQHLGLRGFSVHADNSAMWHAFHELKLDLKIAVGRQRVLFNIDDVGFYNRLPGEEQSQANIDALADRIAAMQGKLLARGRTLVPLIIPGKATIYPEAVPPAWQRDVGEPRPSEQQYTRLVRALQARGVRYADVRGVLMSRQYPRELLWGRYARHWSWFGVCLSMREVLAQRAALLGQPAMDYPCVLIPRLAAASDPNMDPSGQMDLFRVINAWGARPETLIIPEVIGLAPSAASPAPRPSALFVGTSFTIAPSTDLVRSGAFRAVHSFYYNVTQVEWPSQASVPIDATTDEWRRLVFDQDLIVIELFEPYIAPDSPTAQFLGQLASALDGPAPAAGSPAP